MMNVNARNARDTVRETDTLISLSARLLGDPLRWRELVSLNRLIPPYLSAEGGNNILKPGDDILYPLTDGAAEPRDPHRLEAETYGVDLLAKDGDLVLQGGDLATTTGLPNLREALHQRLKSLIGAHPFHAGYGSYLKYHIGKPADDARLAILLNDVERTVLRDLRIRSVEASATWEGGTLELELELTPVPPGTRFSLRVPVPL